MAPYPAKRRRSEDGERKPKKKIRAKKQAEYHSDSDDADAEPLADDDASQPLFSSDAPKPLKAPATVSGFNMLPVTAKAPPKPILKRAPAKPSEEEVEEEDGEDSGGLEELAKNTALNAAPQLASESDADDDDAVVALDDEPDLGTDDDEDDDDEDEDDDLADTESETSMISSQTARNKRKRNDPSAFATSISKILDTKLTASKRSDPVLSRSKSAADANKTLNDERLESKARAQIRAEKKAALEKGRVRDVLGLETPQVDTGAVLEEEKRLKKTAQRGVVKLFNAVRAAQVKGEEAMKAARAEGVVGMRQREERVNEMSKQGFLDLISQGGKAGTGKAQEAGV